MTESRVRALPHPTQKETSPLRAALYRRSVGPRPALDYISQLSHPEREIFLFLRANDMNTARALRIVRSLGVEACLFSGVTVTLHEQDLFRLNQQLPKPQLKRLQQLIIPHLELLLLDPLALARAVQIVVDFMPHWRSTVPTTLPLEEIAKALLTASDPTGSHTTELRQLLLSLHTNDCGRHDVLEFLEGKASGRRRFQLLLDNDWEALLAEARLYGPIPF